MRLASCGVEVARKSALVTGASRGLGKETARQLCERGLFVFVGSRDPRIGAVAVEELTKAGGAAEVLRLDVTDSGSITKAVDIVRASGHRLDVLVNNAGRMVAMPSADLSDPGSMRFGTLPVLSTCCKRRLLAPVRPARPRSRALGRSPDRIPS